VTASRLADHLRSDSARCEREWLARGNDDAALDTAPVAVDDADPG
jgi:hypothetical protein